MPGQANWRAAARMSTVVVAIVFCAGATLARAPSPAAVAPIAVPVPAPPMGNASTDTMTVLPPLRGIDGPFGLAPTTSGGFAARWRSLQPAIVAERYILARCRTNPAACTPEAAKFEAVVAAGRSRSGRARVGEINRAVNLAVRAMSDMTQYGVADVWASPLMTFHAGAGDCEDYAIAKYVALLEAGMAADDVRLVVVYNRPAHEGHMVAAARVDGHWLILDNRKMALIEDRDVSDLAPLALLDKADPVPALPVSPVASKLAPPASVAARSWPHAAAVAAL